MTERNKGAREALKMLGIARRSGVLLLGQDRVFAAKGVRLMAITTEDCGGSVARKVAHRAEAGDFVHIVINGVTREELGNAVGVAGAQIAALPLDSGFAKKIAELLEQGGAHE